MPRLLFLLTFGLVGTAILVWLGVWQLQRLEWKQGILAEIDARIDEQPVALPADPDPETDTYLAVTATGTILPGELHVLVSQKNIGAGYRVIAPFVTDSDRRIMIDRGFARQTAKDAPRALGPFEIIGNLHWPQERDRFTPDPEIEDNIWFARDVPAMARALDTEPVLLVARTQTDPGLDPMPIGTANIPNDHLQYAITWFSLALIWVAMTVFFIRRPRARKTE
ncbi:SURF1 family protein [Sulfitobacter sp. BDSS02]|nr:SURF1 family protein [Sulfitobacter sp. BDSS02]MBR9848245.1 SURF1 family protein [Paracoccaceae bacterium]